MRFVKWIRYSSPPAIIWPMSSFPCQVNGTSTGGTRSGTMYRPFHWKSRGNRGGSGVRFSGDAIPPLPPSSSAWARSRLGTMISATPAIKIRNSVFISSLHPGSSENRTTATCDSARVEPAKHRRACLRSGRRGYAEFVSWLLLQDTHSATRVWRIADTT